MNDTHVNVTFQKLKVHNVMVNSCSFGKIGTFKLQMGLNVALAVLAPKISDKLMQFGIPKEILGHLELSDINIAFYDEFLGIGVTPSFIAPPLPTPPAGTTYASRVCVKNEAGFVLRWHFYDEYSKETSSDTDHYPIAQTQCMNINDALPNVREGETISTIIDAFWGKTQPTEHQIAYTGAEVKTVNFTCTGTTQFYSCTDDANNEAETTLDDLIELVSLIVEQ